MEWLVRHPLPTMLLVFGGSAAAAATGLSRLGYYPGALAIGAIAILFLTVSGSMMIRTGDWGSVDEWGAVATESRQRTNLLIVATGLLAVGVLSIWLGFGPVRLIAQVLFVLGGWLLLQCGVIALTMYLLARKLFA